MRARIHQRKSRRRSAVLLLAVLLVVSAVTLSTLAFMQSMLLGHEESRLTGENIQARYAAESGIDAARLFIASSRAVRREAGGTFNNPNRFQAIPVLQSKDPLNPCNYALIAPNLNESGEYSGVRFGLQNESARLNLNALPIIDATLSIPPEIANMASSSLMPTPAGSGSSGGSGSSSSAMLDGLASANASGSLGRDLLMALPAMNEEIADAILDFIDADDEVREYGCEREYYSQLPSPYAPSNGPLDSIEQLLLVRGVTPTLLFGLDQNRNGVLESSEENAALGLGGTTSSPALGGMGSNSVASSASSSSSSTQPPNLGWAMYLTLYSKEKNVTSDGSARVNLNGSDLQTLRTDLGTALGDDLATFIIAYRVLGGAGAGGGIGGGGGQGVGLPGGGGG
ncbi:MAG: type II secretion system protein GspK, partial [Planctomycetota bacterium]